MRPSWRTLFTDIRAVGRKIVDDRCPGIVRVPDTSNDRDSVRASFSERTNVHGSHSTNPDAGKRVVRRELLDERDAVGRGAVGRMAGYDPVRAGIVRPTSVVL
jgi:hypothetical protein